MLASLLRFSGVLALVSAAVFAAETPAREQPAQEQPAQEQPAPDTGTSEHIKEAIRERLAEDAKLALAPSPTPASTPTPAADTNASPAPAPTSTSTPAPTATANPPPPPEPKEEAPTVLPKVEVKRNRVTETDRELHENARQAAHEKELAKGSEADKALNTPKLSKIFSLFGGVSSADRQRVAAERVELLEAEKDLLEQISLAKTKEEKQELQKELAELRAMRRDLEKGLH